ncbi:MAG: TrkH family potassium uptake protein [Clostridiales Family XIII bacterium]|jgi:trk system potassium uptake protein TrkH|nr:TrkH family potassium uptake protein [Clostridiales Family XIII bacterium]
MNINVRMIVNIIGIVCVIVGGTMLIGLVCALIFSEPLMARVFAALMVLLVALGFLAYRLSRKPMARQTLKIREGILAVALCWIFACVLGGLPYLLSGMHHTIIDAFFESTSCLTTTGSTIFENLAEVPKSLLFWRQFTNWIGGLGIIIFAISIIPMLGFGAANLAGAETTGQSIEKIRARMSDTAKSIMLFFFVLTAVCILLLKVGGVGMYDSFIIAFGCLGNGGFANYSAGGILGSNLFIDIVIVVFCVAASLSFVSYQLLLKRRVREFFREFEIRAFLIMLLIIVAIIFVILMVAGIYDSPAEALRYGVFQVVGFVTTSGYAGADFAAWPQAAHWLLMIAMIVGGCSGSTSGGIKVVRAAVALSLVRRNIYKRLHPNAVVAVKLGGNVVPADRVSSIATFVILYVVIVFGSCFVLAFENLDAETTLGTVIAMLSNTGLVMGPGTVGSFAGFSQFSLIYMAFLMIAGRLEIFTIVLLFSPAFWRPYR